LAACGTKTATSPRRSSEQPEDHQRQRHREAREGPSHAHVKQRLPAFHRALKLDERAKGAQADKRHGDEVWQGHLRAMQPGGHVVPHLVHAQDEQQRGGKGQTRGERGDQRRPLAGAPGGAQRRISIHAGDAGPGQQRSKQGRDQQNQVDERVGPEDAHDAALGDDDVGAALAPQDGRVTQAAETLTQRGVDRFGIARQLADEHDAIALIEGPDVSHVE
jgi:hypothetical protein